MKTRSLLSIKLLLVGCLLTRTQLLGQSITTGEITGVVSDAADAVVPNVVVALENIEKGFTQRTETGLLGVYRFSLVAPGNYSVSTSVQGFVPTAHTVNVVAGYITSVDIKLQIGEASTTIEVTSEGSLLESQNADLVTSFGARQIADVPNPGNDLAYVAQTAPGAVMNTQRGVGTFSTFGLPATSNLFTLDGMFDNDPYDSLNNTGATNLMLGNNEIQEATVVNNGYSGQYGGFAGAYANYITKSGSNSFHGNAIYWWNGRILNANNWFNKDVPPGTHVTPRPFVNANQYAASMGGPIKRNKAFFYLDYEGLRVVLPTNNLALIPSPQFETATLANLAATGLRASIPFYQQMFNLWNGAPRESLALPGNPVTGDATGCNGFVGPGGLGSSKPCALSFRSTTDNFTTEFLLGGRFDFNLGHNDQLFLRLRENQGLQPSYTDPINPLFNIQSDQPIYQAQLSETHTFGIGAVNEILFSSLYASFISQPKNPTATLAAFPTTLSLGDGTFSNIGGYGGFFPTGHSFTHYQFLDDFSLSVGSSHNLKVGLNFRRYDISIHDYGNDVSGLEIPFTLADFFDGGKGPSGDVLIQNFPRALARPITFYGLGLYVQDEWRASRNLTLTLSLRVDHNSNPVCQQNCFARFATLFSKLNHNVDIPYNQAIQTGLRQALPSFTNMSWQPRFGFAWKPFQLKSTVVRGGFGLFIDTLPGILAYPFSSNPPLLNSFNVLFNNLAPSEPSNLFKDAASSNTAFVSGFSRGGTLASISASDPFFAPPTVTNAAGIKAPRYQEWNFEVQHEFGLNTSLSLNYVGNHGIYIPVFFNGINAFCPRSTCPKGFTGLPASPPDPRFSIVAEIRSAGISNYNGLVTSVQHRFDKGFQLRVNYAWSHALDEISNGGFFGFSGGTAFSLGNPQDNNNLRKYSYGNADYDARHYFSVNYLWELPCHFGPKVLLKGWQVSGTIFKRSGFPYTVTDSNSTNLLSGLGYGGVVYANFLGTSPPGCNSPKHPCLEESQFSSPIAQMPAQFGAQRRNQFYGPGFFTTDLTIAKNTPIPGWERGQLGVGVQFFNLLNHPNFDQPNRDIGSSSLFGHITNTVSAPTSIFGAALGGDSSPRLIQLTARISF